MKKRNTMTSPWSHLTKARSEFSALCSLCPLSSVYESQSVPAKGCLVICPLHVLCVSVCLVCDHASVCVYLCLSLTKAFVFFFVFFFSDCTYIFYF